jgi:hypothetical protein
VIISFTVPVILILSVNNQLLKEMMLCLRASVVRANSSQRAEFECHGYVYDVAVIGKGRNSTTVFLCDTDFIGFL